MKPNKPKRVRVDKKKLKQKKAQPTLNQLWDPPPAPPPPPDPMEIESVISAPPTFGTKQTGLMGYFGADKKPEFISDTKIENSLKRAKQAQNNNNSKKIKTDVMTAHNEAATEESFVQPISEDEMVHRSAQLIDLNNSIQEEKHTYFSERRNQLGYANLLGKGPPNASVMIVRGIPSTDDNLNVDTCSSLKELLDSIAKEKGITKLNKYAYYTNLVKVRTLRGRRATVEDIQEGIEILKKEIAIIRPKVIVAIGEEVSTALLQHFTLTEKNNGRKTFDNQTDFNPQRVWKLRKEMKHITVTCISDIKWLGRLHAMQDPASMRGDYKEESMKSFRQDFGEALDAIYFEPLKIVDPTEEFEASLLNKGFGDMESYAKYLGVRLSEPNEDFFDRERLYDIPRPDCYMKQLEPSKKPLKFLLQNARFDEFTNQYYLFGRTEEGYLICTQLKCPTYEIFIKHKSFNPQTDEQRKVNFVLPELADLEEYIIDYLHTDEFGYKYRGLNRKEFMDRIQLKLSWAWKRPFFKFHLRTKRMLQISFREFDIKDKVAKILEAKLPKTKTHHSKVTALERFYYSTGTYSYGWVTIPYDSLEKSLVPHTIADYEFIAAWDSLEGHEPFEGEYAAVAKMVVADFDCEMKGQHGFFPISQQDPIIMIGATIQEYCDPNRPVITQQLRDPEDSSKVFNTGRSNYLEHVAFVLGVHREAEAKPFTQESLPTISTLPKRPPVHYTEFGIELNQRLHGDWNEFLDNMAKWIELVGTVRARFVMSSPRLQEFFLGERTCTSSSTVLERGNEKSYNQWKVKYMNNQVLGPLLKEDSSDPLIYEHWRGRILDLLEEWPSNVPDSEFDNLDVAMPDYKPETIGKIQHQWELFNPKPKTFYFKNEEKLIFSFCEYLRQAGVDMLRGHNINAFDIPYIQQRINVLNIRQTKYFPARANYPISMGRANFLLKNPIPSLREDTVSKKVTVTKASNEVVHIIPDIPGVDYLDTLPWARKEIQPKLKHHTLSYIAQVLVKDQKFDVPGSSISHLFINDLKRLREYLEQDVALTQRCSNVQNATTFAFMFARLVGAIQICELYNSGVQRMINAILMRTLMKEGLNKVVADDNPFSIGKEIEIEWEENDEEIDIDGTNPKKKKKKEKGYKGATCIDPLKGLLIAIWLCWDFSALYPTIMISHGISHDLMGTLSHFKKLGIGVDRLWHTGEKFLNPKTGKDEEWYFLQKRKLTEEQAKELPAIGEDIPAGILQCVKNADGKTYTPKWEIGAVIVMLMFLLAYRAGINRQKANFKSTSIEYAILDSQQLVVKNTTNATYGFTGCSTGKYAAKQLGAGVTFEGRETLQKTQDLMDAVRPGKLGGGDTDSIFRRDDFITDPNQIYEEVEMHSILEDSSSPLVRKPWVEHIQNYLNRHFPEPMRIVFEKAFWPMFMVAKKRGLVGVLMPFLNKFTGKKYFENVQPKLSVKGLETTRRDQLPFTQRVMEGFLEFFVITREEERIPAIKAACAYVANEIQKLHRGEYEIFELVETRSHAKMKYKTWTPMAELCKRKRERGDPIPNLGTRQAFIVIEGDKNDGVSKRVEDPIYVIENGLQPDIEYVTRRTCKPIMRFAQHFLGHKNLEKYMFPSFIKTKKKAKIQQNNPLLKQIYVKNKCAICLTGDADRAKICKDCVEKKTKEEINGTLLEKRKHLTVEFEKAAHPCYKCLSITVGDEIQCHNFTCPIYFPRITSTINLRQHAKLEEEVLTSIL